MQLVKVVDQIWATRKADLLCGYKLLVVESLYKPLKRFVVVDALGAGVGETVLVAAGSSGRIASAAKAPIDATVIAIIDDKRE